jgi:hypothetical protein
MSGDDRLAVPGEWEMEVLGEHVSGIVFDSLESYDPDCALCRRAATAGLFEPFGGVDGGDDDDDPDVSLPALFDPFRRSGTGEGDAGDGGDTGQVRRSQEAASQRHPAAGRWAPAPRSGDIG